MKSMKRLMANIAFILLYTSSVVAGSDLPDGSVDRPLRVMLVPADTGADTTKDDFQPIFNAITKAHGVHFELRAGSSYAAVVEGMANRMVDIAFFGPVTFHQAQARGAAELLAVGVKDGQSAYYSGIFIRKDSGIQSLSDLKDRSLALGDINSTSSFQVPLAMLLEAGIDPASDLSKVYFAGSHANSLAALKNGRVDACACSITAYEKAFENGVIDGQEIVPLAVSDPIPYPPLALHPALDASLKTKIRQAFENIHKTPGLSPDLIRGYGGKKVDRYDTSFPVEEFEKAVARLSVVTDELKGQLLRRASAE